MLKSCPFCSLLSCWYCSSGYFFGAVEITAPKIDLLINNGPTQETIWGSICKGIHWSTGYQAVLCCHPAEEERHASTGGKESTVICSWRPFKIGLIKKATPSMRIVRKFSRRIYSQTSLGSPPKLSTNISARRTVEFYVTEVVAKRSGW